MIGSEGRIVWEGGCRTSSALAEGSAHGDIQLLESASHAMLVRHDNAEREYAYDDDEAMAAAWSRGWTVSKRADFGEVFRPPSVGPL